MKLSEYIENNSIGNPGDVVSNDKPELGFSVRYSMGKELCKKGFVLDQSWNLPELICFKFTQKVKIAKSAVVDRVKRVKAHNFYKELASKSLEIQF